MSSVLEPLARRWIRADRGNWGWEMPRWQAHRGRHVGGIPENTLASLISAAEAGAQMCEFDVRATRDGVPVLFHDEDLKRMTGRSGLLSEITLRELREFFNVTTLEDVLTSRRVPRFLNLEIKSEIVNDSLERRIAAVVNRTEASGRLLFSGFNPFSLWKMQQMCPQVPRALLVAHDLKQRALREMWLAPFLSLQALNLEDVLLPDATAIRFWRSRGFRVSVWTVNEPERIQKYWDWNIDSVITDLIPVPGSRSSDRR